MGRLESMFKFNKRVCKIWPCLPIKWPQIAMSRMEFILEYNKRACSFIRDLRVGLAVQSVTLPEIGEEFSFQIHCSSMSILLKSIVAIGTFGYIPISYLVL